MHQGELGRVISLSFLLLVLCGCGGVQVKNTNTLYITPSTISFGNVTVGQTAATNVSVQNRGVATVEVSQFDITGASFSALDQSLPASIAPGATYTFTAKFGPTAAGATTGQIDLVTTNFKAAIAVSGTGTPGLGSLSCSLSSLAGSGVDSCTLTLNSPAPSGGQVVNLSSSNSAVNLPGTITVPANATTATFNVTASSVSTAQSVSLTASLGGGSTSFALQLIPNGSVLTFNSTSIAFGSTALNIPVTQTLQVTASGTLPVSVTSAVLSGTGFTIVGATFPIVLNPGQSATLNVQFNPKALGAATGQLNISSTALTSTTTAIGLSGTGVAYEVQLTWNAPAAASGISGYNVYRSAGGSSTYQLLNSSVEAETSYIDTTVQSGTVYDYIVESVSSSGAVSQPSNTTSVTIP